MSGDFPLQMRWFQNMSKEEINFQLPFAAHGRLCLSSLLRERGWHLISLRKKNKQEHYPHVIMPSLLLNIEFLQSFFKCYILWMNLHILG